jgi:pimeloyl-ACP methyl ester carboxylesterase
VEDGDEVLIKRFFPKAVLETVAEAGHWVHADRPGELLGLVEAFLR